MTPILCMRIIMNHAWIVSTNISSFVEKLIMTVCCVVSAAIVLFGVGAVLIIVAFARLIYYFTEPRYVT